MCCSLLPGIQPEEHPSAWQTWNRATSNRRYSQVKAQQDILDAVDWLLKRYPEKWTAVSAWVTIFEGGHERIARAAAEWLTRHVKPQAGDYPPPCRVNRGSRFRLSPG